jgi:hypothetical protein
MQVNANEAEEALAMIHAMAQKMHRAVADGEVHNFFILWGVIWFIGFLGSQFLPGKTAGWMWMGLDILGGLASAAIGLWLNQRVRDTASPTFAKRLGFFWLALFAYCALTIWIAWPLHGKQVAMIIIFFAMLGYLAMSFLLSISAVRLALFVTILACGTYFLLPAYFYLCMALLGGGTMVGSGLYIRSKWRMS